MRWLLIVYVAGALLALWRTDGRLPARVSLALLWPVGPMAFVVTVAILLAASLIAFPWLGATAAAIAGVSLWLLL